MPPHGPDAFASPHSAVFRLPATVFDMRTNDFGYSRLNPRAIRPIASASAIARTTCTGLLSSTYSIRSIADIVDFLRVKNKQLHVVDGCGGEVPKDVFLGLSTGGRSKLRISRVGAINDARQCSLPFQGLERGDRAGVAPVGTRITSVDSPKSFDFPYRENCRCAGLDARRVDAPSAYPSYELTIWLYVRGFCRISPCFLGRYAKLPLSKRRGWSAPRSSKTAGQKQSLRSPRLRASALKAVAVGAQGHG